MTAADIVVTKPGGLTTSEALACGTAMAVVNPIPGQESRNSDYLLENGAAVKINNLSTLPFKLDQVLADSPTSGSTQTECQTPWDDRRPLSKWPSTRWHGPDRGRCDKPVILSSPTSGYRRACFGGGVTES